MPPNKQRLKTTTHVQCDVNSEDVAWYRDHYPNASLSWLFTMLLSEFRKASYVTPQDIAAIAGNEARKVDTQ